jgi:hypothetical protein
LATAENNVYNDIRGALIYVEDGNEMYNRIFHNVGICPWAKSGEKKGCTIPGEFPSSKFLQFSFNFCFERHGQWSSGYDRFQQMGRLEGNTFHGCGRFGTYVLASVFPKNTDRSVDKNGLPTLSTCRGWSTSGEDNGLPATFMHNIDYGNVFVGQCNAGDVQYRFHTSINNLNLIYWKETRNFKDGCSAHIADLFYDSGNLALPGGHGAFILENMTFNNQVHFESSHHCQSGVTGGRWCDLLILVTHSVVLCMPTYVFVNMK